MRMLLLDRAMVRPKASVMSNPLLFDAGWQGKKVAGLTLFALLCAVGTSVAGWQIWLSFGLAPADGGMLRPAWQRALLGGGVAALGVGFWLAMLVYARCYVLKIIRLDGQTLQVVLRWPGLVRTLRADDVVDRRSHAGVSRSTRGVSVAAPWLAVWLRDQRLPLIVDDQGDWSATQPVPAWLDPVRSRWLAPQSVKPGKSGKPDKSLRSSQTQRPPQPPRRPPRRKG